MVLVMRMLLSYLLLVGALAVASAAAVEPSPPVKPSAVEQLAIVNYANKDPVTVTTHIENAAGDKLDFNGDHFFGRDQEQHDYNRQAHLKLEHVRNQDPQLRRYLGKSIVKRQADFPYPPAVDPPTHYEPPTTTTTTTTTTTPAPTTTTPPPTTTTELPPPPPPPPTPGVPHEVYGVPPGEPQQEPSDPTPCSDCVFSQLPTLPQLVYPSVPAPVPVPQEPLFAPPVPVDLQVPLVVPVNVAVPSQEPLYSLNELVGEWSDVPSVPSEPVLVPFDPTPVVPPVPLPVPVSSGPSGCSDCTFEQLPTLPELQYPSVPGTSTDLLGPPTPPAPPPSPVLPQEPSVAPSNCLPAEHRVRNEESDGVGLFDIRLQPRVLSPHSQVILVQSMAPYPVLKANQGHPLPQHTSNRGSLKFKHSHQELYYGAAKRSEQDQVWNPNDDTVVVVPTENSQGQLSQLVVCTVDCNAVEEKVKPPETPAMEIPSDGRLW